MIWPPLCRTLDNLLRRNNRINSYFSFAVTGYIYLFSCSLIVPQRRHIGYRSARKYNWPEKHSVKCISVWLPLVVLLCIYRHGWRPNSTTKVNSYYIYGNTELRGCLLGLARLTRALKQIPCDFEPVILAAQRTMQGRYETVATVGDVGGKESLKSSLLRKYGEIMCSI